MKKYDLVVIGSGAGLMVAEVAMQIGVKCALIEKDKFGGTCLTKGCIPSKMLVLGRQKYVLAECIRGNKYRYLFG